MHKYPDNELNLSAYLFGQIIDAGLVSEWFHRALKTVVDSLTGKAASLQVLQLQIQKIDFSILGLLHYDNLHRLA